MSTDDAAKSLVEYVSEPRSGFALGRAIRFRSQHLAVCRRPAGGQGMRLRKILQNPHPWHPYTSGQIL